MIMPPLQLLEIILVLLIIFARSYAQESMENDQLLADDELLDDMNTCDWKARSNFHAIRVILRNKMLSNDTLLYELAGVFSNKQRPLKQVIVHYKVLIPVSDCSTALDCNLQYPLSDNSPDCPNGYHCLSADFIWGRYPTTAQDIVFRDLNVCPLVIGDYEQRQITIYFTLKSPPSCNSSAVNDAIIAMEEFPCGWQCKVLRQKLPSSEKPSEPFATAIQAESPLDRALLETTTKLLQYSVDKEALPSLQYNFDDTIGYAARVNDATYFNPIVEYVLFLSGYSLLNVVICMLMVHFSNEIYNAIYEYVTTDAINFSMFWSFILTFFLFCFNITFVFIIEGGICITVLQAWLCFISLVPICFYPFVIIFYVDKNDKNSNFFKALGEKRCEKVVLVVQMMAICFLFILPHVSLLIIYLASVSFFHDSNNTTFLVLYFTSSSVVLWIANAIVIYYVSPCLCACHCQRSSSHSEDAEAEADRDTLQQGNQAHHPSVKYADLGGVRYILFAVLLGLSFNLINFSIIPFIGDFFYDKRANGAVFFAFVSFFVTILGWYLSGDLVKLFTVSPLKKKLNKHLKKNTPTNEFELSEMGGARATPKEENIPVPQEEQETSSTISNDTTATDKEINTDSIELPNLNKVISVFSGHWSPIRTRHSRSRTYHAGQAFRRSSSSFPRSNIPQDLDVSQHINVNDGTGTANTSRPRNVTNRKKSSHANMPLVHDEETISEMEDEV